VFFSKIGTQRRRQVSMPAMQGRGIKRKALFSALLAHHMATPRLRPPLQGVASARRLRGPSVPLYPIPSGPPQEL